MLLYLVQVAQLVDDRRGVLQTVLLEPVLQCLLALLLRLTIGAAQAGLYLSLGLGGRNKFEPRRLHMLRLRGENLYLVATLQAVAQWNKLVVYLGTDAMAAKEGVNLEGEIECRTTRRHRLDFTLRGEDENLRGEEVELDGVEEVHGIRLRVVEDFLDGAQPVVELAIVLASFLIGFVAFLVLPMGGKTLLGHLIHSVGAYLHLNPSAGVRHQRDMQSLIAVSLRVVEPVAQTVGV